MGACEIYTMFMLLLFVFEIFNNIKLQPIKTSNTKITEDLKLFQDPEGHFESNKSVPLLASLA